MAASHLVKPLWIKKRDCLLVNLLWKLQEVKKHNDGLVFHMDVYLMINFIGIYTIVLYQKAYQREYGGYGFSFRNGLATTLA